MSTNKVGLLCHIGGNFVCEAGKVYYKGGSVRLLHVERTIGHQELLKMLVGVCKLITSRLFIKYKHPAIEFDSPFVSPLVAVEDDNDLCNMMEAYSGLKPTVPFYISICETSSPNGLLARSNSDQVAALNANEAIQTTPAKTGRLWSTPVAHNRQNANSGTLQPVEGLHEQPNLTQIDREDARKQLFQASETPSADRRLNHDSDSSIATGNELGGEEMNSSTCGSSGMPNCNGSNSRRVTRSTCKYLECAPAGELVDAVIGSKDFNFQLDSVVNNAYAGKEVELQIERTSLLKKGLEFENIDAFKKALTEASLLENFQFKPVKTNRRRITVVCVSEGCKWRLHASQLRGVSIFKIKKINPLHTCGKNVGTQNHPNARARFIANFILDRLRENLDYKPKDIISDIHRQYGVKVSYSKAWRGRKHALGKIHGSFEESLRALPAYCKEVERTNLKSIVHLQCDVDNSFQRLFIALHASIYGFAHGCRHLLVFKGISVQGKYPIVILLATAIDANGESFLLAYAIAESDNADSWHWFLTWLSRALEQEYGNYLRSASWLTVISEEDDGIIQAVKVSFPGAHHALCVSQIARRIAKLYNDDAVKDYIWAAASAYTVSDYERCMGELRTINIRAHEWIMTNMKPRDWATSYFEGQRYNVLTSDFGENFVSWISEAKDMPILSIVQEFHSKLMIHFLHQREIGMQMLQMHSVLVRTAEARIQEKSREAYEFRISQCSTSDRLVLDTKGSKFLVSLPQNTCTCCEWQVEGLPCAHAVAAIQLEELDLSHYCQWFTAERFRKAYEADIHPLPDRSEWNYADANVIVKPPLLISNRGRPRTRAAEKEVGDAYKQCSVCKRTGHNKRTCSKQQNLITLPVDRNDHLQLTQHYCPP